MIATNRRREETVEDYPFLFSLKRKGVLGKAAWQDFMYVRLKEGEDVFEMLANDKRLENFVTTPPDRWTTLHPGLLTFTKTVVVLNATDMERPAVQMAIEAAKAKYNSVIPFSEWNGQSIPS